MARLVTPSLIAVATEAEVQRHVLKDNSAGAHPDEELDALCAILNGVSAAIENVIDGPVVIRSFTETYDGAGERIFLRQRPVASVTSVKEEGQLLTVLEDYYVYAKEGYLLRASGGGALWWAKGYRERGLTGAYWTAKPQGVEVVYTAGRAIQTVTAGLLTAVTYTDPRDETIRLAALQWIQESWATGPANLSNVITEGGSIIRPVGIPPQVADKLQRFATPGVAAV